MEKTEEPILNNPNSKSSTMEVENQSPNKKKPFKRSFCCCCAVITSSILILFLIILIILIFTVFKAKDPTINLTSTSLSGVAPRVTLPALHIELNISLNLILNVHNPNYASFKHGRGYSQVYYLEDQVGEVEVAAGRIGSRGNEEIEAKLTLEAEKFDMSSLIKDVLNGKLSFEVRSRVPGRATVLGFIKKHVVAVSTCQIDTEIPSLDVSRKECKTKTKF
ncbi:hypothetical protein ACHQM5_013406 [Ranunculus cassubicifolius]